MKALFFLTTLFISNMSFAYQIRYSLKGEIKTRELRLLKVKDHALELFGANDSIAVRKLKGFDKKEAKLLVEKSTSIGASVCTEMFKSDVVLGINEFNSSTSFCLFKDNSLIPIDSLSSWTRRALFK